MLEVFDTWAGMLAPHEFREFALPYLKQIAVRVKQELHGLGLEVVPMVLFAKGANYALEDMSDSEYDVLSLDWTVDPAEARRRVGAGTAIQGNIDPCVMYASPDTIREKTRAMVDGFGTQSYIANLGHGIYPDFDPEHVGVFVDEVQSYSASLNSRE